MQQGVAKTPIPRQRFAAAEARNKSILPMFWDMVCVRMELGTGPVRRHAARRR